MKLFLKWRKLVPAVFCLLIVALFGFINYWFQKVGIWNNFFAYSPAFTYVCEFQNEASAIRQPINTLSNVLFLFFGIEIIILGLKDRRIYKNSPNLIRMNYHYSILIGSAMVFMFFASSFYHASMLDIFAWVDMIGIYACLLFPLMITIHKIIAASWYKNRVYFSYEGSGLLIALAIFLLSILAIYFWNNEAYFMIPSMVIMLYGLSLYYNYYYVEKDKKYYLMMSFLMLGVAMSFYMLDKYYCMELSYFQLHSFWHILAATAMYYFYIFLRTEKNLELKRKEGV